MSESLSHLAKTDSGPGISNQFEIPTFREVVENAMHIYGPPVKLPPMIPTYAGQTHSSIVPPPATQEEIRDLSSEFLAFPFMKFTCNGTIKKLMFVSDRLVNDSADMTISPSVNVPDFSLWQQNSTDPRNFSMVHRSAPFSYDQYVISHKSDTVGLIEVNFTSSSNFKDGDFLGLKQRKTTAELLCCYNIPALIAQHDVAISLRILRQERGYDTTKVCSCCTGCDGCSQCQSPSSWHNRQITPFVAVETGEY